MGNVLTVMGSHLMAKWELDEFQLLQCFKLGLKPHGGSFNTQVKVSRLLIAEDTPSPEDLSLLKRLQFSEEDVSQFEKKHHPSTIGKPSRGRMTSKSLIQKKFNYLLGCGIKFSSYAEVCANPEMASILKERNLSVESRKVREYLSEVAKDKAPHLRKGGRPRKKNRA